MNNITFSQGAVDLIKLFEGFRSCPYLDAVNVPTIGYGTTFYQDGTKVTMQDSCIDEPTAALLLINYLNTNELPDLQTHITVDLTQNEIDALGSLIYNIGDYGFDHSHVLIDINQGILSGDLETRWYAWDKAGGQPILLGRREKEYHYFETGSLN